MSYHSGASRFIKLLGVAWLSCLLLGYGIIAALLPAVVFALLTWLAIRKTAIEDYSINTKPTFFMIAAIALIGWGGNYQILRSAGSEPGDAAIHALASLAGVLLIVALIGAKVAPPISYASHVGDTYAED